MSLEDVFYDPEAEEQSFMYNAMDFLGDLEDPSLKALKTGRMTTETTVAGFTGDLGEEKTWVSSLAC